MWREVKVMIDNIIDMITQLIIGVVLIVISFPFMTKGRHFFPLVAAVYFGSVIHKNVSKIDSFFLYLLVIIAVAMLVAQVLKRMSDHTIFKTLAVLFGVFVGFMIGALLFTAFVLNSSPSPAIFLVFVVAGICGMVFFAVT